MLGVVQSIEESEGISQGPIQFELPQVVELHSGRGRGRGISTIIISTATITIFEPGK